MYTDTADSHQSRVPENLSGTIILTVLATVAVAARLFARKLTVAKYCWDDLLIILALMFLWGISVTSWIAIVHSGVGRHSVAYGGPVEPKDLSVFFKTEFAILILYLSSATAIKTSLILLYWRIFRVIRWFRWLLTVAWTVVTLYFTVVLFVAIFECTPIAFYWDQSIKGGTCINQTQFYRWNGVANLLIDFMIWSLTLPVVWRLKLSARQKLSLSTVFFLGIFACIASIIRVTAFNQVNSGDVTYTIAPAGLWTVIEQSMGIICACLPTTKPLLDHLCFMVNKNSNSHDTDGKATHTPLKDFNSRSNLRPVTDIREAGFARLDEESAMGISSIATHAAKIPTDRLPVMTDGIMTHQTIEQHFGRRARP